jgi:ABC-type glycerol-3-phosphate transport system substrate-binding protein
MPALSRRVILALALATALPGAARVDAKEKAADPNTAVIWTPIEVWVKNGGGVKRKFGTNYAIAQPGLRVVDVRVSYDYMGSSYELRYKVRTTFVAGHTYCWQYDQYYRKLYFNDLGENFTIPKLELFGSEQPYRDAMAAARELPEHDVEFLPP